MNNSQANAIKAHTPRYMTHHWKPVTPWRDGLTKPRKLTPRGRDRLLQWADENMNAQRANDEHRATLRVILALAIGETLLFVEIAALWAYVLFR